MPDIIIPITGQNPETPVPNPSLYQPQQGVSDNGKVTDLSKMSMSQIMGSIPVPKTAGENTNVISPKAGTERYPLFNPMIDNEEQYAQKQGVLSKWGNALVKTGAIALTSAASELLSIPDYIRGAQGGNVYKNDTLQHLQDWTDNLENQFPNYYTKWEQEHPFLDAIPFYADLFGGGGSSANFWADKFIKNTGYTIGAMGAAILTDLAVGAVTEGIGEIPLISQQLGKLSLSLNKVFSAETKLGSALGFAEESSLTRLLKEAEKAGANSMTPFTVESMATAAASQKILNGARYGVILYGASHAEAAMEARQGYNDVKKQLTDDFYKKNGYYPEESDKAEIEKVATASANTRYAANIGILLASNALQFNTLIKPFTSVKNSLKTGLSATVAQQEGKIGVTGAVKEIGDIENLSVLPEKSGFLPKVGRVLKKNVPNILAEGVWEEGGQFVAEKATKKYFEDKYNGKVKNEFDSALNSIVDGLKAEFGTDEGLENVILGSLTGALFGPITKRISDFRNKKAGLLSPQDATNEALGGLDKYGRLNAEKGVLGIFQDNYDGVAQQMKIQEDLKTAVENNDVFKFKNLKSQNFFEWVAAAVKANRFDVRVAQLEMLKELPQEEIAKWFNLQGTEDATKYGISYIDKLIDSAKGIKSSFDAIGNIIQNPYRYRPNSKEVKDIESTENYLKFENYKTALASISFMTKDFTARKSQLMSEVQKVAPTLTENMLSLMTTKEGLHLLHQDYAEKAERAKESLKNTLLSAEEKLNARNEIKQNEIIAKRLQEFVNSPEFNSDVYASLFNDILNQRTNSAIPHEQAVGLIQSGVDLNRLKDALDWHSQFYNHLFTQEGYDDFVTNYDDWVNSLYLAEEPKTTQEDVEKGREYEINKPLKYTVRKKRGEDIYQVIHPLEKQLGAKGVRDISADKETAQKIADEENKKLAALSKIKYIRDTNTGLIEVIDNQGNTQFIEPEYLDYYNKIQTEEEIVAANAELNKAFSQEQNNVNSTTGADFSTPNNPTFDDGEYNARKDIITFFSSGTTNEQRDGSKPINRVLHSFTTNFDNFPNKDLLKVITVTKNNEKALGAEGLADYIYKTDDIEKMPIALVVVEQKAGKIQFVDQNGNPTTDITKMVVNVLPTAELKYTSEGKQKGTYRFSEQIPEEKAKDVQAQYKELRRALLANNTANVPVYDFTISTGRPVFNANNIRNTVADTLVPKSDINKQGLLKVVTLDDGIQKNNKSYKFPKGALVLDYGATLVMLNNRKLTNDESLNIYNILKHVVTSLTKAKPDYSVVKSPAMKYLQALVYTGEKSNPNRVWFNDGYYYIGENYKVPFTVNAFEANKAQIIEELKKVYTVANNKQLRDNEAFIEITAVNPDGSFDSKRWNSYQEFLISDEGREVGEIPFSTTIAKNLEDAPNFLNRYITAHELFTPNIDLSTPEEEFPLKTSTGLAYKLENNKAVIDVNNPVYKAFAESKIAEGMSADDVKAQVEQLLTEQAFPTPKPQKGFTTLAKPTTSATGVNTAQMAMFEQMQAEFEGKTITTPTVKETPKEEPWGDMFSKMQEEFDNNKGNLPPYIDEAYRTAIRNEDYVIGNLDKEQEWFEQNLSIPFNRLQNVIRKTSGGYAWGQFKNAAVYVYENALEGTSYHEAFEAVWGMFTTPLEQAKIIAEFRKRSGGFVDYMTGKTIKFSEANPFEIKEQLAEEFRYYKLNNKLQYKSETNFIAKFFNALINFIRKLFTGENAAQNERELFKRIDSGFYKTAATTGVYNPESTEYNTIGEGETKLSQSDTYRVVNGVVFEIFQELFKTNTRAILDFDEGKTVAEEVYDKVYTKLQNKYTRFPGYEKLWTSIQTNWNQIKRLTGQQLQTYGIVQPEGRVDETDVSFSSKDDSYLSDPFTFDFTKKAPTSVKILLSTLGKTEFDPTLSSGIRNALDGGTLMPITLSITEVSNKLMETLYRYNTPEEKKEALRKLAEVDADYMRLWNRLNLNKPFSEWGNDEWVLFARFTTVFSKQKPTVSTEVLKTTTVPSKDPFNIQTDVLSLHRIENDNINFSRLSQSWVDQWKGIQSLVQQQKGKGYNFNGAKIRQIPTATLDQKIAFLNTFHIPFTKDMWLSLSTNNHLGVNERELLGEAVVGLKEDLIRAGNIESLNAKDMGISGNLGFITNMYIKAAKLTPSSTYINPEGNRVQNFINPNYISKVINDINQYQTKQELLDVHPEYNQPYQSFSVYLNELLYKDDKRTSLELTPSYTSGTIDTTSNKGFIPIEKMSLAQRSLHEMNNNLSKNYYVAVAADRKTQDMVKMEHIFTYEEVKEGKYDRLYQLLEGYYQSEQTSGQINGLVSSQFSSGGRVNLGMFNQFVLDEINSRKELFTKADILTLSDGKYNIKGLNTVFKEKNDVKDLTKAELDTFFKFVTYNFIFNTIEQHKLFYGKSLPLKRYKSSFSPVAQSFVSAEHNNFLNSQNSKYLKQGDPGYWHHKPYMDTITFKDVYTDTIEITEDKNIKVNTGKYKTGNITDAQAFAPLPAWREMRRKSGEAWLTTHEEQYQYLMAKDRLLMAEDTKNGILPEGTYIYTSEELRKSDEDLVKKGGNDITFSVSKPLFFGQAFNQNSERFPVLDKYSIAPIFYSMYRTVDEDGNVVIGDNARHYIKMLKEGISYGIFESGRKVGAPATKEDYFESQNRPYSQADIVKLPFDYWGIQVETDSEKTKNTLGKQLSHQDTLNLMSAGVPSDVDMSYNDWANLTETQKEKQSPFYKQVKHTKSILNALREEGYTNLLNTFGIKDEGNVYTLEEPKKVERLLQYEMFRRELSENKRAAITFNENGEPNIPFEATSAYQEIKSVLYSYVDKLIAKPKVNGGQKTQVSSIGYSKNLKFYSATYNEEGKRTKVNKMQVALPNWFADKLRKAKVFQDNTNEEIIEYLNKTAEGRKILSGIGFRIPTQNTNSIEVFEAVSFLPKEMGDTVLVPHALTVKAGSDFDIDKLNTYLKNIYIDSDGNIKLVPFFGVGEQAKTKLKDVVLSNLLQEEVKPYLNAIETLTEEDFNEGLNNDINKLYRQSLENEYFESLEKLMLIPERFEQLIAPNSKDELVAVKDALVSASKKEFGFGDKTTVLSNENTLKQRQIHLIAKGEVGKAALGQTNNAITQLAPIVLDKAKYSLSQNAKWLNFAEGQILLPHNTVNINGVAYPTISKAKTVDGKNYISDIISEYIDGFVDVSNDPFIGQIIQNPMLTAIFITMHRLGMSRKTVGFFMNQPIIREYVKMLEKKGTTWLYQNDKVLDDFFSTMLISVKPNEVEKATNDMLSGKTTLNEEYLLNNIKNYYSGKGIISRYDQAVQKVILYEFLKYASISGEAFTLTRGVNYDNAGLADDGMRQLAENNTLKALNSIFTHQEELIKSYDIKGLIEYTGKGSKAISEALFKINQPGIVTPMVEVRQQLINARLPKAVFQKANNAISFGYIDYLLQTNGQYNQKFQEYILDKSTSVADRLFNVKKALQANDLRVSDLANNDILKVLLPVISDKERDTRKVVMFMKSTNAFDTDKYTTAFRELKNNPFTAALYEDLVTLSFLQYGVASTVNSYSYVIPHEDYSKVLSPILSKVELFSNLNTFSSGAVFYRNSWSNKDIVPQVIYSEDNAYRLQRSSSFNSLYQNFLKDKGLYKEKDWLSSLFYLDVWQKGYNYPVITLVDTYTDQKVLLRRLDNPVTGEAFKMGNAKSGYSHMYYPINAWGNSDAKEYYDVPTKKSIFENGYIKVDEADYNELVNYISSQTANKTETVTDTENKVKELIDKGIAKKEC